MINFWARKYVLQNKDTFMSNKDDFNKLAQTIAQLSARAKKKLTGGMYYVNIESDEDTLENITDALFLALADDLTELGITLNIPLFDLYGQDDVRWSVLEALKYVFPTFAYYTIRDDAAYNQMLKDSLSGASGDESTLYHIMEYLSGNGGQRIIMDQAAFKGACILMEGATSNELFDNVMGNLISIARDEKQKPNITKEDADNLVLYTTNLMSRYADALACVDDIMSEDITSKVEKRIFHAISDLTRDDAVVENIFRFLSKPSTWSEEGKALHHLSMKEYFCGCKLCPSYNTHRNIDPTTIDFVGYLCYWYAHFPTVSNFTSTAQTFFKKHLFSQSDDLIDAIMKLYDKGTSE